MVGESSLACLFDEFHGGGPPTRRYEAFLAEMAGGGLARFFAEYRVLGRLAGSAVLLFVDAFAELLDQLERDRGRIRGVFGSGRPDLGPVVRIRPYLSDPHRAGAPSRACRSARASRSCTSPKTSAWTMRSVSSWTG